MTCRHLNRSCTLACALLFLIGCSWSQGSENQIWPGVVITRSEMGDEWPFTLDEGRLNCIGTGENRRIYFTTQGRAIYALNEAAIDEGKWASVHDTPIYSGKDLTPMIARGLELCG